MDCSNSLATGLMVAILRSSLVRRMLKLEIPIDLVNPASTSWGQKDSFWEGSAPTHLLHGLPGGGDIVGQRDIELGLALGVSDNVVPGGANTLWGVNLEVDLAVSAGFATKQSEQLTFQCMR